MSTVTTFYYNPFALISFSSFLIMMMLGILLWQKYYTSQTKYAVFLFGANAIYSFFYAFEISFKSLDEIIWFYRLEYFGIPFLSVFYLMFALHFSGRNRWLTARNKILIFTIPVITLLLVLTNELHHLFYVREYMNLSGPFPSFSFVPGYWYYVHQIYVIVVMLVSLVILGTMIRSSSSIYRKQLIFLLAATIFPFLGYLAYQLHLVPFGIDPVSSTFTLTGITVYVALARFKLFDLVPIARTKLFEKIQDGLLVLDLNNRMVDFNPTVCLQLQISRKDLGKSIGELVGYWPEIKIFIESNQKGKLELQRYVERQSYFYSIEILELENSKNIKQGKLVVIKDITDLINKERERNYTASKLDAVIKAMPDMMFVIDSNGVFTDYFSSDPEKLFLNKDEVLGATLNHLFNKEEADTLMALLKDCLATNKLTTHQYEMSFPGTKKNYEARISRLDEAHVLAIIRDITESQEMKQDLLYQSGFQKILMQLASRFIYISTSETDFVINDSLRQIGTYIGVDRSTIFRYDFEKNTMTNSHEWCSEGTSSLIDQRQNISMEPIVDWTRAHQLREPATVENLKKLNSGNPVRLWLEAMEMQSILTIPMISQKNCLGFLGFESVVAKRAWFDSEISLLKIFTGMLANLQEKITIEHSLVEAKIKAEASNKLKTAFMNNISHEIRTPLNGIIGFGEIIANEQLSLEEKNQFLTVVQESSERLIRTIDDYLDISMLVTGNQEINPKHFNVSLLIEEVIDEFTPLANQKQISISSSVPEAFRELFLYSDYELIRKILSHLVSNSLKFTEKGSVLIGLNHENDQISIFVKDTGIGIAENAHQYVFDSFMQEDFSSTRLYEGSGLGLAIVKGIVTLLGGDISLTSVKGEGTTFNFTIPKGTKIM